MTAVCSVGIDMVIIPGDTTPAVIRALIADEAAIGMVNSKTTAVRVIPAIGRKAGEILDFGGLLGYGPIMPCLLYTSMAAYWLVVGALMMALWWILVMILMMGSGPQA